MKYLIIITLSILLSSCWTSDLEDAKELGFSSVEEMNYAISQGYKTKKEYSKRYLKYGFTSLKQMESFQSAGYETMSDYKRVKERTPGWFLTNCEGMPNYKTDCFGKRIAWFGVVNSVGLDSTNIEVISDRQASQENINPFGLRVDSKSINDFDVKKGQLIRFHGRIDKENFITPDIEDITFVRFESKEKQAERNKKRKKSQKEAINKEKEKEKENYENNKFNAGWLMSKYEISAGLLCSREIPKLSKYDHKWTDGWYETKFSHYKNEVSTPGVLTVIGDKIKFQNGFGAWMKMQYWCKYDTQNKIVIDYGLY